MKGGHLGQEGQQIRRGVRMIFDWLSEKLDEIQEVEGHSKVHHIPYFRGSVSTGTCS
jgi:hypothetical protein